jgi:hypothetical protein
VRATPSSLSVGVLECGEIEIQPKVARDLSDQEVTIVKVSRDPAG